MSANEQANGQQQEQAAPIEEVIQPIEQDEPDEQEQQQAPEKPSEVDEIAREMGWAPQNEWKGPKESWKTAKEFIRHGTVIHRQLKERTDAQQREFDQRIQRLDRASMRALTKQREQLSAQFEAEKRQAVSLGDVTAYETVNRQQSEALKRFDDEAAEIAPKPNDGGGAPPEVIDFAMANRDWFDVDPVMTGAFVALNKKVSDEHPHLSITERLTLAKNELMRRFGTGGQPNGNGNGQGGARVEGGLRPIKTAKGKDWESLPAEAKSSGKKFIDQGLFKTKEEYATDYWAQE